MSTKVQRMSVIEEWRGTLPVLLPIIGEFAGSICRISDFETGRMWDEERNKWVSAKWSEIIANRLQITFRKNKFDRYIRVIHYGRKLVFPSGRQLNLEPCKEMWPDFCLRARDWRPRLELETIVQEQSRELLRRLDCPARTNERLTKEHKLINHKIGMGKTDPFEIYALRQALQKIVTRRYLDVHNYDLRRD